MGFFHLLLLLRTFWCDIDFLCFVIDVYFRTHLNNSMLCVWLLYWCFMFSVSFFCLVYFHSVIPSIENDDDDFSLKCLKSDVRANIFCNASFIAFRSLQMTISSFVYVSIVIEALTHSTMKVKIAHTSQFIIIIFQNQKQKGRICVHLKIPFLCFLLNLSTHNGKILKWFDSYFSSIYAINGNTFYEGLKEKEISI